MFGCRSGELEGEMVEALLPSSLRAAHEKTRTEYMQSPAARKMGEGRELSAVKKDGAPFPVEVGLNPYVDKGRAVVLVSIIALRQQPGDQ